MASIIVPPGGFAGFAQMTPASRSALSPMGRAAVRSSRRVGGRKRKAKRKAAKRASGTRKRKSTRKIKFGSPAWQKKYKTGAWASKASKAGVS